jgi:hypothetical protein
MKFRANKRDSIAPLCSCQRQASRSEARELDAALRRYFDYRARATCRDLRELFRIGRRALAIGLAVLSSSVIVSQTAAAYLRPLSRNGLTLIPTREVRTGAGGIALPGEAAFAGLTPIKVFQPKWHIFIHRLLRQTGSTEAAPPTAI